MKRLTEVYTLMENTGFSKKTMLDELVLWLSDDEVSEFLEDLKTGWDLPENAEKCSNEH